MIKANIGPGAYTKEEPLGKHEANQDSVKKEDPAFASKIPRSLKSNQKGKTYDGFFIHVY